MLNRIRKSAGSAIASLGARLSLRKFVRAQDGAAAVEFGLVALPFFGVMFAIIETALVLFASQALETAVADSARLIMTGQAQNQGLNQSTFKTTVCANLVSLFNCSNLYIDVEKFSTFGSVTYTTPLDNNGNINNNSFTYAPGGSGDIVMVRFMYPWKIYTSLFGSGLVNMSGNQRLLVATAAFRNEPF